MRNFFVYLVAVVAVWFWSTSALAINLIYEPFDYTFTAGQNLGPPDATVTYGFRNTQAGTTAGTADNSGSANASYPDGGIGNKWVKAVANASQFADSIDIFSGSLSGPSELKASVGNSLTIFNGTNSGNADRLAFRQAHDAASNITTVGTSVYYSFLLNVTDLTGVTAGTGDVFLSLNNTANNSTTPNPTVIPGQIRARADLDNPSTYNLGMFTNRNTVASGDAAWSATELVLGQTYFIVGKYTIGTAATNGTTRLFVNPDPLSFGVNSSEPTTGFVGDGPSGGTGNTLGSLLLHQRNTSADLILDEIRVATTWAEVTPLGTPTLYWDIDGATAGAGGATPSGTWDGSTPNWNDTGDGTGTAIPWASDAAAVFSAGTDANGTYTITVSGTQSANQLTFEDGGTVTLTGGQVNLTGSLHTISVSSGQTATIQSVVGGSVGFVKEGAGTLVLTASETYSGTTTINGGTVQLGNGGTSGTLPTGSAITVNGRLTANQSDIVTQGTDFSGAAIAGTGGVTQAGSGTLTLNAANTYSGTTRAAAGTLLLTNSLALQNSTLDLNGSDTGTVTFDGSLSSATVGALSGSRNMALLNGASAALAITVGNATGSYSGALSGSGSLTKAGTGSQTLSGANTYAGGTTINAGTLQFAQTVSMPAGQAISGDYNGDGKTDGADYVTWRNNPGAFGGNPGYTIWRANFGANSGGVTVNSGGTLGVNAGGTDEWTDSTDENTNGTIGSLIKGKGGQAGGNVTWMNGSTLAIDTTNAPGAPTAPALTYNGVIGGFRTAGGGTTDAVGFTKHGTGTLTLNGNNTFSGQLSVTGGVDANNLSILELNGTNLNAGTSTALPTVSIGAFSQLRLGASQILPAGSLITTQTNGRLQLNGNIQTVRSISGTNGFIEVGTGRLNIADQAGDDYSYGIAGGATISATDGVFNENVGTVYKTGAGTLTLMGPSTSFNGTFVMENGTLKLSANQALGGATSRLVVEGGQLARSNTPTGNFTYSTAFVDMHVFRFDLSDAPAQTSQFNAAANTTLKEDNVEINITNTGTQNAASGRFAFQGEIQNHDDNNPNDNPLAIRGFTKTGNGVLSLQFATNTYKGSTTVMDGVLLVDADASLGDYTPLPANIGALNLKGGMVATTTTRTAPIKNPVVVNGAGGIAHVSTAASASTVMEFDNDSIVGTSGTLTITNGNTANNSATVFRPRFTGNGFNFGLPIVVSDTVMVGTGAKSNELQSGNTTGTQTYSGVISGGGSFARVNAGGTAILTGANTYTGNTSIDAGTLSITNAYLADTADVLLTTGGIFNLGFAGTDTINRLFFDGLPQAVGTWGATGSGATNIDDTFFTGSGVLNVLSALGSGSGLEGGAVPEPHALSLALLMIGSAYLGRGRRARGA